MGFSDPPPPIGPMSPPSSLCLLWGEALPSTSSCPIPGCLNFSCFCLFHLLQRGHSQIGLRMSQCVCRSYVALHLLPLSSEPSTMVGSWYFMSQARSSPSLTQMHTGVFSCCCHFAFLPRFLQVRVSSFSRILPLGECMCCGALVK